MPDMTTNGADLLSFVRLYAQYDNEQRGFALFRYIICPILTTNNTANSPLRPLIKRISLQLEKFHACGIAARKKDARHRAPLSFL